MIKFSTLQEDLKQFLIAEKEKWRQWVICFIHVGTEPDWIHLVGILRDFAEAWPLSRYCQDDDVFPNWSNLFSHLKSMQQSVLLVPLPAHMRVVKPSLWMSSLKELIRIVPDGDPEKRGKLRVYVPLYGVLDHFSHLSHLAKGDPRLEEAFLLVESTGEASPPSRVTVVNSRLLIPSVFLSRENQRIQGYKQYLAYWEGAPSPGQQILLFTELANSNEHSFEVAVLTRPFEVLEAFCPDLRTYSIREDWGSEECWKEFLNRCTDRKFMKNIQNILDISSHEKPESVLSKWKKSTSFEKWLIVLWLFLNHKKGGYLELVFQEGFPSIAQFEDCLVNALFSTGNPAKDPRYWELYQERKKYLQAMGVKDLPPSFWEQFNERSEPLLSRLHYLTDCTKHERERVVSIVGATLREEIPLEEVLGILLKVYPGLYRYLAWDAISEKSVSLQADVQNYFREYVQQKVADLVKPEFVRQVKTIAETKGKPWWQDPQLHPTKRIVDQLYQDEQTIIYWVDNLGLEYLGYLINSLSQKEGLTYTVHVGYAELPTTTEKNKAFLEGKTFQEFRKLDELKHNNQYSHPESIVAELDLLQEALDEAISHLKRYKRVLLTSDHGASRLAVLSSKNTSRPSYCAKTGASVEKYGRYCVDEEHDYGSEISTCIDFREYHVLADYGRFADRGGGPVGEVHGGATLEEVLVPIIEIQESVGDQKTAPPQIRLESKLIKLQPGSKLRIRFEILPETKSTVMVQVEGNFYECKREGRFWFFEIETKQPVIQGVVIVGGQEIGNIEVSIQRGIVERDDL